MSSYITIQKVCLECKRDFVARKNSTKFCSHSCNSRHYKRERRKNFINVALIKHREANAITITEDSSKKGKNRSRSSAANFNSPSTAPLIRELLDVRELAQVVGMSERSIYRLMKDIAFPRLRIGRRILFDKNDVIHYLNQKYSNA